MINSSSVVRSVANGTSVSFHKVSFEFIAISSDGLLLLFLFSEFYFNWFPWKEFFWVWLSVWLLALIGQDLINKQDRDQNGEACYSQFKTPCPILSMISALGMNGSVLV